MPRTLRYGESCTTAPSSPAPPSSRRWSATIARGKKVILIYPPAPARQVVDIRQALAAGWPGGGALDVEVTVSSSDKYVSFLEGYSRALDGRKKPMGRARLAQGKSIGIGDAPRLPVTRRARRRSAPATL